MLINDGVPVKVSNKNLKNGAIFKMSIHLTLDNTNHYWEMVRNIGSSVYVEMDQMIIFSVTVMYYI